MSALALALYLVSKRVSAAYERIALIAARTAILVINFGFWIGSCWSYSLSRHFACSTASSKTGGACNTGCATAGC